jgi:hypothetical protein
VVTQLAGSQEATSFLSLCMLFDASSHALAARQSVKRSADKLHDAANASGKADERLVCLSVLSWGETHCLHR